MFKYFLPAIALVSMALIAHAEQPNKVDYPTEFRTWQHIKSMVIEPGHPLENPFQGIHHIYANPLAAKGYKENNFPDGSIIVFDLLHYDATDNALVEGNRKLVGVMQKDRLKYADTGGWGFEGFAENSTTQRLTSDGGQSCFGCHASQADSDYVFSKLRL